MPQSDRGIFVYSNYCIAAKLLKGQKTVDNVGLWKT